jgi:hypothetical protein
MLENFFFFNILKVEPTGSVIICAFNSGVIRMLSLDLYHSQKQDNEHVKLIQVLKPHTMKITRMSINPNNKYTL